MTTQPTRTTQKGPDALADARAVRRTVLGDAYVDAAKRDPAPAIADFQEYVTQAAWGVWARGGSLSPRDRSLIVLAITAALSRTEEFKVHATSSPRAGVTQEELDELVFQIAAYAGVPAGVSARRMVTETADARAEARQEAAQRTAGGAGA